MHNPIIHRELTAVLRQPQALLLQCALAFALTLLIVLRWPTDPRVALSGARSQEVFRLFAYGLFSALALLLPVFPATSIVREKNQGTLALLFNTPLGAWRIFSGKLLAALGLAALMLSLSLPAAAACYALGGVSLGHDILPVYGLLALTAFEFTAVALLISTFAGSTAAAVRGAYGLIFGISVLTLVPHYFFIGSSGIVGHVVHWLRSLSPVAAFMSLLGSGDLGGQGTLAGNSVAARFAGLSLVLGGAMSVWVISRLNHTLFDKARSAGLIVDEAGRGRRLWRRLWYVVDPQRRSTAIGDWTNPVMVKEFRCRRFGRLSWLARLVAGCAVLSLALAILTTTRTIDWDAATIGAIMVLLQVGLLLFITPSLTAGLLSAERETGGWKLLQMTPLPVRRIVWGKLLSVMLTLALVLCATLPGYVVMVAIDPGQKLEVQRVVACLVATAVSTMFVTAAAGSLFRRTAPATATAYALVLTLCAGPMLVWLGRDAPFGHRTVERALSINPVAAAFSVIRLPGFREYQLIPANWWFLAAASLVSVVVLTAQAHRISRPQ